MQDPEVADSEALRVMIRVAGPLRSEQRRELEASRAEIHSAAGDVISASIPKEALGALADLGFVVFVEASRPLDPEEP